MWPVTVKLTKKFDFETTYSCELNKYCVIKDETLVCFSLVINDCLLHRN